MWRRPAVRSSPTMPLRTPVLRWRRWPRDLSVPWAIDFAPDGRIFFTERGGRVMVIGEGEEGAVPRQVLEMDVGTVEGGLLGIALDPDFAENRHVYLYYTYADFIFTYNKVSRFTEGADGGGLTGEAVLIDGIPGGAVHNGGRIRFADDGTLYITTGMRGTPRWRRMPDRWAERYSG